MWRGGRQGLDHTGSLGPNGAIRTGAEIHLRVLKRGVPQANTVFKRSSGSCVENRWSELGG